MYRTIKITLNSDYFIEIDPLNCALKQQYSGRTKDGKPRAGERVIGYFGNLRQCVERYMAENQLDELAGQEMPLVQYVRMIENANKKVMRALEDSLQRIERILEGRKEEI